MIRNAISGGGGVAGLLPGVLLCRCCMCHMIVAGPKASLKVQSHKVTSSRAGLLCLCTRSLRVSTAVSSVFFSGCRMVFWCRCLVEQESRRCGRCDFDRYLLVARKSILLLLLLLVYSSGEHPHGGRRSASMKLEFYGEDDYARPPIPNNETTEVMKNTT